ncbi:MAG: hypothetical protein AB3N63_01300 [Puniceicoccaceae bacterium]
MDKKDMVESLLFAGFRVMALLLMLTGLLGLVFQLLEAWDQFDPNYLGSFVTAILLRPIILILTGLVLHFSSGLMARLMAARFNQHGS